MLREISMIANPMTRRTFMAAGAAVTLGACATTRSGTPSTSPTIDGLSFLPDDLADIRASRLSGMICDVSEVQEIKDAQGIPRYLRTFDVNDAALDKAAARLGASEYGFVALRGSDLGRKPGCAAFLQLQSCEPVGTDLSRIARFHGKGLRVLQFTHHNNNLFAGGALERVQSGLTPLGRDGLGEMNRLRILPDVSHGSEATMIEAATSSRTPIVISHGACKAIVDHPRCASDAAIRAVAERGGMMGIFMMSFWLTRDPVPKVEHLIANLRHVIRVGGIDAVGISNDFPMAGQTNLVKLNNDNREGVKEYLPWWIAMRDSGIPGFAALPEHVVIPELNTIDRMAHIRQALERDRFTGGEIDRIMGGNWARVLTDVLG
jgi:membrane dipeptidase